MVRLGSGDPDDVANDVRNELVTLGKAKEEYGVVIDEDTRAVDPTRTSSLRQALSKRHEDET